VKKLSILIADDEAIIRMGLKEILEEAGHEIATAKDGVEAVRLAESISLDLVILDIKMPEMDGLEAARVILERARMPIIFLTAYGERELIERATQLPVMGYLVKPIKEPELLAMIEVAVNCFQAHASTAQSAAEMQSELAARRVIDRAKGLLMQREGISELEAYTRLQARARAERRTLQEIANAVNGEP
jgi:AmiR/NasT family two-component response regulator